MPPCPDFTVGRAGTLSLAVALQDAICVPSPCDVVDVFLLMIQFAIREQLLEHDAKTVVVPHRRRGESNGDRVGDGAD